MSYNSHHWGPPRHHNNATSTSGQSTGEGGAGGGGRHSLEMEPMLSSSNTGSGHGHKGNDKIGNALGRLTGGSGSSKYHGKRTSSSSAGKLLLIGLACLAMMYLGFGVGRDGQVDTAKSPTAGNGGGKPSSTTPMVRKPNPSSGKVDQKQIQESEMPNDDDEPSDEDEEDDKMLESSAEDDTEEDSEERKGEDDTSKVVDRPYVGSLADKEDPKLPESIANAVVEDTEALEDDEDEDDDATQNFAPEDDENEDGDGVSTDADNADTGADDDDSTEDFADEDKDGVVKPSPEEKLAQQNLEDDDNVVDDDTVSPDTDDDADNEGAQDDDEVDDDDEDDDAAGGANAIAQKLLPGGVSKTPIMDYRIPDSVHKRFIKWSKELHQITEMEEYKGGEPKVNWEWHPRKRRDRFPGVEERVSDDFIKLPVLVLGVFRVG